MDFKTLFEEARKVDPTDDIHVEVSIWAWQSGNRELTWRIWSHRMQKGFSGQTPELVLRMYRDKVVDEPVEDRIGAIGAPTL